MIDDDKLLKAITSVVYDIEMKRRARLEENNKILENNNIKASSLNTKNSPAVPPGLTRSASSITNPLSPTNASSTLTPSCSSNSVELKTEMKVISHEIPNENHERSSSNNKNDKNTTKFKGIERLTRSPPPLLCESNDLYNIILSVRSNNGRFQKAFSMIKTLNKETNSIDSSKFTNAYVQNVVKSVCILIGCPRLDTTVSLEDIRLGFERYVRQSQKSTTTTSTTNNSGSSTVLLQSPPISATTTMSPISTVPVLNTVLTSNSCTTTNSSSSTSIPPPAITPMEVSNHKPLSITITPPKTTSDREYVDQNPATLAGDSVQNPHFSVGRIPNNAAEAQQSNDLNSATTSASSSNTSTAAVHTAVVVENTSTSVPIEPLSLPEVYEQFWELSHKLFLYVCNPYRHCHECLCVVEGTTIVNLLLYYCSAVTSIGNLSFSIIHTPIFMYIY